MSSLLIRRAAVLAALPLALTLASQALAQQPANPNPSLLRPGAYAIEPLHTRVLWSVSHMGFTTYYGEFPGASGRLVVDPAHPAASQIDVTIPIAGVTTTNTKLDGELRSSGWLDATRFPTATFHSTQVTVTGPSDADVTGDLTLHGVTRPETLHVHFNGAGNNFVSHAYTSGFDVSGVIRRSAFGVTKYVPLIGDETRLIISAAFEKAPG